MRFHHQQPVFNLDHTNPVTLDSRDLSAALSLLKDHGDDADDAIAEASIRAMDCRERGNIVLFCRWRQVARFLSAIADPQTRVTHH